MYSLKHQVFCNYFGFENLLFQFQKRFKINSLGHLTIKNKIAYFSYS